MLIYISKYNKILNEWDCVKCRNVSFTSATDDNNSAFQQHTLNSSINSSFTFKSHLIINKICDLVKAVNIWQQWNRFNDKILKILVIPKHCLRLVFLLQTSIYLLVIRFLNNMCQSYKTQNVVKLTKILFCNELYRLFLRKVHVCW